MLCYESDLRHNAVHKLIHLIRVSQDVAENVLATIHNSCEDMEARKIIEGLLGDDDREFVFCD